MPPKTVIEAEKSKIETKIYFMANHQHPKCTHAK